MVSVKSSRLFVGFFWQALSIWQGGGTDVWLPGQARSLSRRSTARASRWWCSTSAGMCIILILIIGLLKHTWVWLKKPLKPKLHPVCWSIDRLGTWLLFEIFWAIPTCWPESSTDDSELQRPKCARDCERPNSLRFHWKLGALVWARPAGGVEGDWGVQPNMQRRWVVSFALLSLDVGLCLPIVIEVNLFSFKGTPWLHHGAFPWFWKSIDRLCWQLSGREWVVMKTWSGFLRFALPEYLSEHVQSSRRAAEAWRFWWPRQSFLSFKIKKQNNFVWHVWLLEGVCLKMFCEVSVLRMLGVRDAVELPQEVVGQDANNSHVLS